MSEPADSANAASPPRRRRTRPTVGATTQRDVAQRANVDPSVVSRIVNNEPSLSVSDATRSRVLEVIEELKYRPNMMARGLATARTWTIGLLLPDIANPAYSSLVDGAREQAEAANYVVVIGSAKDGTAAESAFAHLLGRGRVDGLIFASATIDDAFIASLAAGPAPLVVVNRRVRGVPASVTVDDARASMDAVRHLMDLGHRHLGHVAGPTTVDTGVRRLEGFMEATRDLSDIVAHVRHTEGWDAGAGYRTTLELLRSEPTITGLYVVNVLAAVGALRAAAELGRQVPDDLSVVAYQDYPLAEYLSPPLTTIAMPFSEAGAAAVDLVIEQLEGQPARSVMIATPPRLVVRQSTAPPSSARVD